MIDFDQFDWTKNLLPEWSRWKFIPEIFNTRNFNDAFLQEWESFYPKKLNTLQAFIDNWYKKLLTAFEITRERWGNVYSSMTPSNVNGLINRVMKKAQWIDEHKNFYSPAGINTPASVDTHDIVSCKYFTTVGTQVCAPTPGNLYIKVDKFSDGSTQSTKVIY